MTWRCPLVSFQVSTFFQMSDSKQQRHSGCFQGQNQTTGCGKIQDEWWILQDLFQWETQWTHRTKQQHVSVRRSMESSVGRGENMGLASPHWGINSLTKGQILYSESLTFCRRMGHLTRRHPLLITGLWHSWVWKQHRLRIVRSSGWLQMHQYWANPKR